MNNLETQITTLLRRAGSAHGVYESSVLKGVYDQDWAVWYADWALKNGLPELLGTRFMAEQFDVASFGKLLFEINEQHVREGHGLSWAEFTAQRLEQVFVQGVQ